MKTERKIKMIYGTSYFKTFDHACLYYRPYGYEFVSSAVTRKIEEGEIHIGKPTLKENETGEFDKDGRFQVTVME